MGLVFWLTFNVIGAFLSNLLDTGIGALTDIVDRGMTAANVNPVLHSLVIDGIFTGVGSVLSFLPVIVTLFFFLSMLEDSGYMARVAFVMDKLLRKIGLSGRSVVPMLIGFGDSAYAVYELLRKAADLQLFCGGVFPGQGCTCDGHFVFHRHFGRYFDGFAHARHDV